MKGLLKNIIVWLLFCGSFVVFLVWGFEINYDCGWVDFVGWVMDIFCSVVLNGGQYVGSGNVWLVLVSLVEVYDCGVGVFMKLQLFILVLLNCQLCYDGGVVLQDEVCWVSVCWVDGFLLMVVGNENVGYLVNILLDGVQNIYLVLLINDNNILDKSNKIVLVDLQ